MSFTQMKRDALYALATENFGVEVSQTATKPQIIAALAEEGVTWEMAKTYDQNAAQVDEEIQAEQKRTVVTTDTMAVTKEVTPGVLEVEEVPVVVVEKPVAPVQPEVVLLKMDRENQLYEIRGYRFTRENPYVLVNADDADFIISHEDGFKMASPREAKEFYG